MLFKQAVLNEIAAGRVTVAFRRWRRPTVRADGTLRTAVGVLSIDAVEIISVDDIGNADAECAGYPSRDALLRELNRRTGGDLYRIDFRLAGDDPRIELRERTVDDPAELEALRARLERMDRASASGPWTYSTLRAIAKHPATRAAELAASTGMDREPFKRNVRKLKNLGLTESLGTGYRISPRGEVLLRLLSGDDAG